MIRIVGVGGRNEMEAAKCLLRQILSYWPWVEHDTQSDIRLIVGTNCVGQEVEDIDLVLLAVFAQPPRVALLDCYGSPAGAYLLGSVCSVIEVKEHHRDAIVLQGDSLLVRYGSEWKSAVEQNRKQMHALRRFLEAKGVNRPFIQKFVWLKNVEQRELSGDRDTVPGLPYLLFKDSAWRSLLTSIWLSWRARNPNAQGFGDGSYFISADISRRSPADFDAICQALTSERFPLKPAVFEVHEYSHSAGESPRAGYGLSEATGGGISRLLISRVIKLLPALLIVGVVASLGSIMGLMNVSRWMTTPSSQTSGRDTRLLPGFAGRYRCQRKSGMDIVIVSETADHLSISSGRGGAELWPISDNKFRTVRSTTDFRGEVVFTKSGKNKVLNLIILSERGERLVCPRSD